MHGETMGKKHCTHFAAVSSVTLYWVCTTFQYVQ